jgi:hypothetical protein
VDYKGAITPIFETEVISNNLNPLWKTISIPVSKLSNGDIHNGMILFECKDHDTVGKDRLIGKAQV